MAQLCDYSSLIFALNTTVLLITSLTTDYWEYRGFDVNKIIPNLMQSRDTLMVMFVPFDTNSYFQVTYKKHLTKNLTSRDITTETYHAPLFLKTRFINVTVDVYVNRTTLVMDVDTVAESEINLFRQYGNLFRDCDALEDAVRVRLGLLTTRPTRCVYFHAARQTSPVYTYAPQLVHMEYSACCTALLCIVSMSVGSCCGAYALFVRYPCFRAYKVASCLSLIAGFLLTLGIALFHAKCHVLRKLELVPDAHLPARARQNLNEARVYTYGWSFKLAWICVFFCYISSYVWLSKSQGAGRRPLIRWLTPRQAGFLSYIDRGEEESIDIATV